MDDETESTRSSDDPSTADEQSSSCCRCLFFFAVSLLLAWTSLAAVKHYSSTPPHSDVTLLPPSHEAALNASAALRRHGNFHITAALLLLSPDLFFPAVATLFAIPDSTLSNLSHAPPAMRRLLRFHSSPSALPMADLFKKPPGTSLKTLVDDQDLVITKNDVVHGSVSINNVLVSDPDIFLDGPVIIHGLSGPFDPLFSYRSSILESNGTENAHQEGMIEWVRIVRLLSSKGFVSFAIGLNAVLDGIVRDCGNLGSVTVFAPPNSGFLSSASPFLDRIVRVHIVPQRFDYVGLELAAAEKSSLRTLVSGYDLNFDLFSGNVAVNGVEVTGQDLFSSEKFVVHGISREFDGVELFGSVR